MPLVTGADFGLNFSDKPMHDYSPIVKGLGDISGMMREKKQAELLQQEQQAQILQKAFKTTALNLLDIAGESGLTKKRLGIVNLAKKAKLTGEDTAIFNELLSITNDDELNTAILQIARQAGDADKQLSAALKSQQPVEQFEPIYQEGEIVAQRNIATNKVEADPRARSSQSNKNKGKFYPPITLVHPETGEKRLVMPVGDPTSGTAKLADVDIPEGFEISKETPEEQRAANMAAKIETAGAEVTAKGQASRGQGFIDRGLVAADSMANLNRGIELLEMVETGGASAVAIKARQWFGIETGDEAELSNRLGKAVLSQLRETFGAAFTAKEGQELKGLEAGLTKSTAGNLRILEQGRKIVRRAANRGIKAAIKAEDYSVAQEIKDALAFKLGDTKEVSTTLDDMSLEDLLKLKAAKEAALEKEAAL